MEDKWTAVHTRAGWEKKVVAQLMKKGIESYCPLNRVERPWRSFRKVVCEPLFNSTVFIRLANDSFFKLMEVPGVINFVYYRNRPAVIENKEIQAMKEFLDEYKSIQLEKSDVVNNESVRVISSPIKNYLEGVLAIKNNVVKVVLPSLGYILVAEVQRSALELLHRYSEYFPEAHLQ